METKGFNAEPPTVWQKGEKMDTIKHAIIAMMVLSLLAGTLVAGTAALEPTISTSTGEVKGMQTLGVSPDGGFSGYNIIWDNGMDYTFGVSSQNDTNVSLVSLCADDFSFIENQTVKDVHWSGEYFPSADGGFDWEITFYTDDGNKPGTVIASFYFPNAETHETFIDHYCDYYVDLPTPVECAANTKYWISIQGIGDHPPQSYWGAHRAPILLSEALFKSDYFGFPDWTNFSDAPGDMCFQLTSGKAEARKAEAPTLMPTGLVALAGLLSAIAAVAIVRKRR